LPVTVNIEVFGLILEICLSNPLLYPHTQCSVTIPGSRMNLSWTNRKFEKPFRDAFERDSDYAEETRDKMRELSELNGI